MSAGFKGSVVLTQDSAGVCLHHKSPKNNLTEDDPRLLALLSCIARPVHLERSSRLLPGRYFTQGRYNMLASRSVTRSGGSTGKSQHRRARVVRSCRQASRNGSGLSTDYAALVNVRKYNRSVCSLCSDRNHIVDTCSNSSPESCAPQLLRLLSALLEIEPREAAALLGRQC